MSKKFEKRIWSCIISSTLICGCTLHDARGRGEEELRSYVRQLNGKLRHFVERTLFRNGKLREDFKRATGGRHHHKYPGGLLDHTLEVLDNARWLAPRLGIKGKDKNDLYAACMLHDFGKIEAQKTGMNHSRYGYQMCMDAGFPRIANMIATHHGKKRFGAMANLNEQSGHMCHLLCYVDTASAKGRRLNDLSGKSRKELWNKIYRR